MSGLESFSCISCILGLVLVVATPFKTQGIALMAAPCVGWLVTTLSVMASCSVFTSLMTNLMKKANQLQTEVEKNNDSTAIQ